MGIKKERRKNIITDDNILKYIEYEPSGKVE